MRWRPASMQPVYAMLAVPLLALWVFACTDSTTSVEPNDNGVISVKIISQLQQTGLPGEELREPLRVQATEMIKDKEEPVPDIVVNFVVTSGGGFMYAGTAATDKDGIAADYWTIGPSLEDDNRVEVRSVDSDGTKHVWGTFYAYPAPDIDPPDVSFDMCIPEHLPGVGHPVPGGNCGSTFSAYPGEEVLIWAEADDCNSGGSDVWWKGLRVDDWPSPSSHWGINPWSGDEFDCFQNGWTTFVVLPDWKQGSHAVLVEAEDQWGNGGFAVGELIVLK